MPRIACQNDMHVHIYGFATDEQLEAGIKWHLAIIEHLDREARPEKFSSAKERINYFGVVLPEKLSSLNVKESANFWLQSKSTDSPGCELLQTLYECTRDLGQISHEIWLREIDVILSRKAKNEGYNNE